MKDRALLTGASGFLGNQMLQVLSANYQFITVGRSAGSENHFQLDLSKNVTNNFPAFKLVIHCAGKAHVVPGTAAEEAEFYNVNLQGTINLCQSLLDSDAVPEAFIFISTVAVYGVDAGNLIREEHALDGVTPYAKSKIQAEQYLQNWAKKHQVRLSIFRLPLIAGPNPPGNLGAMIKGIRSSRYLSIGKATAKKSIVWAADVADLIPVAAATAGIFNLTDGRHPSFRELEICIATALEKKTPPAIPMFAARIMGRVGDLLGKRAPVNTNKLRKITSTLTFDDQKARKMLNWKPSDVIEKLSLTI
jgi:nucleoside-diphosphate-sugar epimerase